MLASCSRNNSLICGSVELLSSAAALKSLNSTFAVLLCAVLLAACSSDGESEQATGSVGWAVDSIPIVDIGDTSLEATPVLLYAADATRLSNGEIVVADAYAPAVRYFAADGHLIRTVGRRGNGPGEFSPVWWMGQCGADSVFVWEPRQQRMRVLDDQGTIVREFHWPVSPTFQSCSRDGVFLLQTPPAEMGPPSAKSPHYRSPIWIASSAGDTIRKLGDLPYAEVRPLGKITQLAVSNSRLLVGTADSGYVDSYTLSGDSALAIRVGNDGRAPSEANFDRALDSWVAQFPNRADREKSKELLRSMMSMPDRLPPYSDVLTDPDGNLWIVLSAPGDSATHIRAVDLSGKVRAEVMLPNDFTLFEVGRDYLLGRYEDPDSGAHHVALYRLNRAD